MNTPVKVPAWMVELINVYADDIQTEMQPADLFEIAKERDFEAADHLRMGVFSMWALET